MTTTPRMLIDIFEVENRIYAAASVSVLQDSDDAEATLYDSSTGTGTLLNPQTLDSLGKFAQAVYAEVPVYLSITGIHAADHTTGVLTPGPYAAASGNTADRPTLGTADDGYRWWDATLGQPIWWTGTAWVDATGAGA